MNVLVLGGSGMLAGFSERLVTDGHKVRVTGRRSRTTGQLFVEGVDWTTPDAFVDLVQTARPDAVVAWVHRAGTPALIRLAGHLADVPFVQVRGSAAGSPDAEPSPIDGHPGGLTEVILGYMSGPRWLTDVEISNGVYKAWLSRGPRQIVGQIVPWEGRP